MPEIKVVTLGAGQDVGRSCVLVSIGGRNIMLDCGMHAGFQDQRKFPDFSYLTSAAGELGQTADEYLTCVIISHFHLDHCAALPHLTEIVGYNGPVYMTYPTKAICPVLLEDYRRVQREFRKDSGIYTSEHIQSCMRKVIAVGLHENIKVGDGVVKVDDMLTIRAFYAGHVLGAAMFEVRVGAESIVYTGDYNTTPDRHLGAAQILPGLKPDLLITETTYATTIRDSKRARERDFLKKVHDCVDRGGKVLIPVFALGRAQELCILIESYWERMDLKVPIYFSAGLAEKANSYYKLFINWTNEKIKRTFVHRNMFEFKHIKPFDANTMADEPGPLVLFATPGMLHGGQSLRMFKLWAPDANNLIIMPGYCVAGTPGHAVIQGARKVQIDKQQIEVNLGVEYMSFSAHADAKGIMQLIRDTQPRNVMFVHGEKTKMEFLKEKVEKEFRIPIYMPANGETINIESVLDMNLSVPRALVQHSVAMDPTPAKRQCPFNAYVAMQHATLEPDSLKVLSAADVAKEMNVPLHAVKFTSNVTFKKPTNDADMAQFWWSTVDNVADDLGAIEHPLSDTSVQFGAGVCVQLEHDNNIDATVTTRSAAGADHQKKVLDASKSLPTDSINVSVTWMWEEDDLADKILAKLTKLAKAT